MIPFNRIAKVLLLILAVCLVYYPSTHAGFIWDDDTFLTRNPVMASPDALNRFWLSTDTPDYFPLVSTNLWVQKQIWGFNPLGFHWVNIAFHALNAVLVWGTLALFAVPGAWVAALVFAVHPVQVESVSWITEIKNLQSTFFYLLAACCYLLYDRDKRNGFYALSLAAFLPALLSKTSVVMFPVVLLLYHWWKRDAFSMKLLTRTGGFFILSAVFGAVTLWFQYQRAGAKGPDWDLSFMERFIIAGRAVWFYLGKLLMPVNLTFVYPRWSPDPAAWVSYLPHLGLILVAAIFYAKRETWGRHAAFGLGYFILSLLPVLGFFNIYFMRYSFVADHWQYIASLGAITLAVGAVFHFAGERKILRNGFVILLIAGLAGIAWTRQAAFQNNVVLWEDTLKKNPAAWIAHNNMGIELELQGKMQLSVHHYQETLRLKPDYAEAEDNLGLALLKMGRQEESKIHFQNAIRLDAEFWEPYNNLGTVLASEGNYTESARNFETSLKLNPHNSEGRNNLALILDQQGHKEEALKQLDLALEDPVTRHKVHTNIGAILLDMGRVEEAIEHFRQALLLQPDFTPAQKNLNRVLGR